MKCDHEPSVSKSSSTENIATNNPEIAANLANGPIRIDWKHSIGKGIQGEVYRTNYEDWVAKEYIFNRNLRGDENVPSKEAEYFNLYYGPGSAFMKDDLLYMRKIPGIPLINFFKSTRSTELAINETNRELFYKVRNGLNEGKLNPIFNKLEEVGIVHRDLNRVNILYDPELNQFNIVDFGRADKLIPLNKDIDRGIEPFLKKSFDQNP